MVGLAVAALPCPALAATAAQPIDARGDTVGTVAFAIGKQARVSISLKGNITSRPARPVRGRLTPEAALRRLAASANLDVRSVGPAAFALSPKAPVAVAPKPVRAAQRTSAVLPAAPDPETRTVEIVVTASKRDTSLPHFAGQWTRIRGSEFSGRGAVGTDAIESRTVGVSSTHLGSGRNKLFIRGIADSSFSGPTQSPVGQYFGDLRTGYSGPDPDLRLIDMDSVEILEGPQGTLYGAGALGGIVLLKPGAPDPRETALLASAGLSLTQHGDPSYDLASTLNLPLSSDAALRVTGYHAMDGGYVDNSLTRDRDVNRVKVDGGRAILSAEVAPDWSVDLTATAQRIHGDDSQYADDDGGLSRKSLVEQPFDSRFALASLVVRKDVGPLRFRSTTGLTRQDVRERFDASIDNRLRALDQRSKARQFSSETRLWRPMRDGWSWLAGISLIENRYTVNRQVEEDGLTTDLSGVTNRLSEMTLFGEVGVALTSRIEASAGGRYTVSKLHGSGQHMASDMFDKYLASEPGRTERRFLPSASLVARPFDGLTLYARYQQGFRPGGLSVTSQQVHFYRHDLLASAELGFRFGKPRSDRVDLTGSITRTRWTDIQADYLDPSGLPLTDNIGDGRIWSVSMGGGWKFAPGWRAEAGFAWNDGKITNPSLAYQAIIMANAVVIGRDGLNAIGTMRIPNIAKVIGRVALDWTHSLPGGRELQANLYARYVGHSRLGVGPRLGERQGDYFDSGLLVRLKDGQRGYSLSVVNLTDSVGNRFAFGAPILTDSSQLTPLRPRTVRLGIDWGF